MAKHFLDAAKIGAAGQQMGGKTVPESMRSHGFVDAGAMGRTDQQPVNALTRQPAAEPVEKKMVAFDSLSQKWPSPLKVTLSLIHI